MRLLNNKIRVTNKKVIMAKVSSNVPTDSRHVFLNQTQQKEGDLKDRKETSLDTKDRMAGTLR